MLYLPCRTRWQCIIRVPDPLLHTFSVLSPGGGSSRGGRGSSLSGRRLDIRLGIYHRSEASLASVDATKYLTGPPWSPEMLIAELPWARLAALAEPANHQPSLPPPPDPPFPRTPPGSDLTGLRMPGRPSCLAQLALDAFHRRHEVLSIHDAHLFSASVPACRGPNVWQLTFI